jgi:hypothetical protein
VPLMSTQSVSFLRRLRRFRCAFRAGASCVRVGAPGLELQAWDDWNALHTRQDDSDAKVCSDQPVSTQTIRANRLAAIEEHMNFKLCSSWEELRAAANETMRNVCSVGCQTNELAMHSVDYPTSEDQTIYERDLLSPQGTEPCVGHPFAEKLTTLGASIQLPNACADSNEEDILKEELDPFVSLDVGTLVSTFGLRKQPECNNRIGEFVGYCHKSHRCQVRLMDIDRNLLFLPDNLKIIWLGTLEGINSRPELNGAEVFVDRYCRETDRVMVSLEDTGEIITVKLSKLHFDEDVSEF